MPIVQISWLTPLADYSGKESTAVGGSHFAKNLHRSTVPASTGALFIGEGLVIGAVPIIVIVYVFPFVRPIRVWLLVLPPSTSTLSLLPPPPV